MSTTSSAEFFDELRALATAAEAKADASQDRWFRIGGLVLRIRFLGLALAGVIVPALAHLEIAPPDEPPALVLRCWDCVTLGQPFPAAPVGRGAFTPRGEVNGLTDRTRHVAFEPGGQLLSALDRNTGEAFYCVGNAALIPRFDAAEPIRILLAWFMRAHGRQLVHAGAVGDANGGVLLLGRSGAGKSNTALACLNDGMGYVSDDFCAASCGPDGPVAYSLYCTAKTRAADRDLNPFLDRLAPSHDPTGRDKVIYYLHQAAPQLLRRSLPVRAVLLVRQGTGRCCVEPVFPARALAACAPDTARLLADAGGEVLSVLGKIVRTVPCYTLHLGVERRRIAPVIADLLHARRATAGDA